MGGRLHNSTHESAISKINSAAKYASEVREHLEEVIRGPAFKGTQRSQAFLRHVVERSLAGDFDSLRERSIGIELFSRPADYDTGEDAVVRVTASEVRKRLLQHYNDAGAESKYRIELPSGSYLPEFHILGTLEPASRRRPSSAVGTQPSETIPATPRVQPAQLTLSTVAARRLLIGALVCILAGGAVGLLVGRRIAQQPVAPDDLIGEMFTSGPGNMQVIISDEGLVMAQVMLRRVFTLQEYEDFTYLNAPELQAENTRRITQLLAKRQIGNIGDIQNAVRLNERLRVRNWDVHIRHAREMHVRDFRGGNFIVLGDSFGNPWAGLFPIPSSNFPLEEPKPTGRSPAYLNLHPQAGEPASFPVTFNVDGSRILTYARVSLLDNISHTGKVLLVGGQSVSATDMAADFLFHQGSGPRLWQMLRLPKGAPLPNLEMILRVTEANQVGEGVELVACRKLVTRNE